MAEYMVLDVNAAMRRVALLDRLGGHHVTLVPEAVPLPGEFLHGGAPERGLNVLSATATGQVYRMVFEAVNCGQQSAIDRLHPAQAPALVPPVVQSARQQRSTDTWDGVVPQGRSTFR